LAGYLQSRGRAGELPPGRSCASRATFEATPEQNALRPGAITGWKNLFLAGDWTDTGCRQPSKDRAVGKRAAICAGDAAGVIQVTVGFRHDRASHFSSF